MTTLAYRVAQEVDTWQEGATLYAHGSSLPWERIVEDTAQYMNGSGEWVTFKHITPRMLLEAGERVTFEEWKAARGELGLTHNDNYTLSNESFDAFAEACGVATAGLASDNTDVSISLKEALQVVMANMRPLNLDIAISSDRVYVNILEATLEVGVDNIDAAVNVIERWQMFEDDFKAASGGENVQF